MKSTITLTLKTLVLAGLGLAVFFYLLSRWDRSIGEREARYRVAADAAIASGRSYRAALLNARETARSAQAQADLAVARLASSERTRDSLQAAVRQLPDGATIPLAIMEYVHVLETRDSTWAVAFAALTVRIQADSSRADLAEARVRLLEPLVSEGRKLSTCRILVVRCPSRTTSFVAGAVTMLVVMMTVK